MVRAPAGDRHSRADHIAADENGIAHQSEKLSHTASVQRHVDDGFVFDKLADGRAFGFEQGGGAAHFDGLGHLAELEREIESRYAPEFENETRTRVRAESRGGRGQAVASGRKQGERILSLRVRHHRRADAGVFVGEFYVDSRQPGLTRIGDDPCQRSAGNLGPGSCFEYKKGESNQRQATHETLPRLPRSYTSSPRCWVGRILLNHSWCFFVSLSLRGICLVD